MAVATSSDAKAAVKDGRLTRTLLLDGGKLRLDPTSDTPRLSEDRAVHLWAAGSMPGSFSEADEPVAVLARVTLQVPVIAGPHRATCHHAEIRRPGRVGDAVAERHT